MEKIIRIKYTKEGILRYISHLNLVQIFNRAIRRAGLPVSISNGFNPRFRISFGPPLPLGINSQAEYLDLRVTEVINLEEVKNRLNQVLPEDLKIIQVQEVTSSSDSLAKIIDSAAYIIVLKLEKKEESQKRVEDIDQLSTSLVKDKDEIESPGEKTIIHYPGGNPLESLNREIGCFLRQREMIIDKPIPGGLKRINIRPFILTMRGISYSKGILELELYLSIGPRGNIHPRYIVEYWLNQSPYQGEILQVSRQELYIQGRAVM